MKNSQRGIVVLFTVLTIGLLVGVGVAMATLSQKQLVLSNIGKQSQVAFYAADTGAECARYWDYVKNAFADPIMGTDPVSGLPIVTGFKEVAIYCNGMNSSQLLVSRASSTAATTFQLSLSSPVGQTPVYNYCADVTVTKDILTGGTRILSRGYNLPCVAKYSTRKVERAVQLTY